MDLEKRFNTTLKLINEVNSNIAEKLMAHKNGLDGRYLTPTREQCFKEFKKAIIDLTINPAKRQEVELESQQKEITELQEKNQRISNLEVKQELTEDALNTLLQAASGKKWGHTDEEVAGVWDIFTVKFNKFLKATKDKK